MATLLHIGFFGIELGAVLCKVLTSVPSAYAVTLAGEEYANEVEMANAVFRRVGGPAPPEQESGDPTPPEPDAPASGGAASEPTASDAAQPGETDETAARLEEGARLAKAQAAARARRQGNGTIGREAQEATPPKDPTLTEEILDGPIRRGRGRPAGAKNKTKTANDGNLLKQNNVK